jgi:hypothetical protein
MLHRLQATRRKLIETVHKSRLSAAVYVLRYFVGTGPQASRTQGEVV